MTDQLHPLYVLGSLAFLFAGVIIGYAIGYARGLQHQRCPHCRAGHPFKSPAGWEDYHIIPTKGGDAYQYARCERKDR